MIALGVVVVLALDNIDVLLGVPPDHALVWAVPATFAIVAALGLGWGLILRSTRPADLRPHRPRRQGGPGRT